MIGVLDSAPAPEGAQILPAADAVFCFSYLSWQACVRDGGFHSEARFASALLESDRVGGALVANTMRSLPRKLVADALRRGRDEPFPSRPDAHLLEPVRLRRREPTSLRGVERAVAGYDRALAAGVRRMGLKDPVAIVSHPLLAGLAELPWARAVTFYATDDWSAYPPARRWWPAYHESFSRLRQKQRRVAAVSQVLLDRLAPRGPSAVVANGLDPAEWSGAPAPPAAVDGLRHPLAIYAGTLDGRLDVDAVLGIALAHPEASILLIGPLLDEAHLRPLQTAGNVVIRPPVGRSELAGLLRAADVGLIPHRVSALTEAMSPLKLYEYLAAGLPVLASNLAPMRGIDPRVVLMGSSADAPGCFQTALRLGPAEETWRSEFIAANSWHGRHEALLDLALA